MFIVICSSWSCNVGVYLLIPVARSHTLLRTNRDATHFPSAGQTVNFHYVGSLQGKDGEENLQFDSSRARGKPMLAKLGAGQLIRAFEEVLPRMSLGQICTVIAEPHYAYGAAAILQ